MAQQQFYPFLTQENQVVTFQVALMAPDGVVLASDTAKSTVGEHRVTSANTLKINFANEAGAAYMFSGDDSARYAGKFLLSELQNGVSLNEGLFKTASKQGYKVYRRELRDSAGMSRLLYKEYFSRCRLIVANSDRNSQSKFVLWYADFYKGVLSGCEIVATSGDGRGFVFGGDTTNPALFIIENYYQKWPVCKTGALIGIASHAVLAAGRHGAGISGLDVVCGKFGKFERLPYLEQDRIEKLIHDLEEWTYQTYTGQLQVSSPMILPSNVP